MTRGTAYRLALNTTIRWCLYVLAAYLLLLAVSWWLHTGHAQDCDVEYDVGWSGAQEACVGP